MQSNVLVIIGVGGIGMAIAKREGAGKIVLLADINEKNLTEAARDLVDTGYAVETQQVDVASQSSVESLAAKASTLGNVLQVVNTAGLSPNMASVTKLLEVDLLGAVYVLESFVNVIAEGGSCIHISSIAGHMIPALGADTDKALAVTPANELLNLPVLQPENVPNTTFAYCLSKRANHLRIQAESLKWAERGARVNSISPGIILTALAKHELDSPIGDGYRAMIQNSGAKRVGTVDEVASLAHYLLGPDSGFVTGSDFLIDGGVIAAMKLGKIAL
ncbi:SDR family oxidoreductase [Mucilaginibacter sp. 44-25]|uniref:SDR family oxidoreductase n=1 Tax=Mucilaginibacter sp. 44-25 TaxID=1895794 RepID=UPI00095EA8D7|nr:SDR family oxidoreductase [Mucilaginibacter sp. 44-25]OJW13211.1 MAG: short-chain dehydrogenase [Mucilaginibacter sp. 44-25]